MRILMKLLLVAASGLAAQTALAAGDLASLGQVKGQISVNHGTGFVSAASGTALAGGDQVMARSGSKAVIRYTDGCEVNVAPGAVATVEFLSPCRPGSVAKSDDGYPDSTPFLVAGGAFLVVGGASILIALSSDNSASP